MLFRLLLVLYPTSAGCLFARSRAIPAVFATFLAVLLGPALIAAASGEFEYQRLKSFGYLEGSVGSHPSELLETSDGLFYGTTAVGGTNNAGTVFRLNRDGTGYTVLHTFSLDDENGGNTGQFWSPPPGLIEGIDGMLYGTTIAGGGASNGGTVFKLRKDGSGYQVLHRFTDRISQWIFPVRLMLASDGALYGTDGTVFTLNTNGTGFRHLHKFTNEEGTSPSVLVEGLDGALYGTCSGGGLIPDASSNGMGTVFKIQRDGTGFQVLHRFTGTGGDGKFPMSPLVMAPEGTLYGTTTEGGIHGLGTLFRLASDGTTHTTMASFSSSSGTYPWGRLVVGDGGIIYGTCPWGGAHDGGTIYKLSVDGIHALHDFAKSGETTTVPRDLMASRNRLLVGTTYIGGAHASGTIFQLEPDGSGFAVLHEFKDPRGGEAAFPTSTLLEGRDGMLYGMTTEGGTHRMMLFKLERNGANSTVLLDVSGPPVEAAPCSSPLVEARPGSLYGTTRFGGENNSGTVFTVNTDGTGYHLIHSFEPIPGGLGGSWSAEANGIISGRDGLLYGTTRVGGAEGNGALFKLNLDGSGFAVIHDFSPSDAGGYHPHSTLLHASDGLLYGCASEGGDSQGRGTIFRVGVDGSGYTVLRTFRNSDGQGVEPRSGLIEGSDGALYGTTSAGTGIPATIFRLNKDGSGYQLLHRWGLEERFNESWLSLGLIEASDGRLYGANYDQSYRGSIFCMNKDGTGYAVIHDIEASYPLGGLVQGSDGTLYGTTIAGGKLDLGTVFALRPRARFQSLSPGPDGSMILRVAGMPGTSHRIQKANALGEAWETLHTLIVPAHGLIDYTDASSPAPRAFYRTVSP